jgi:predicted MPP superfamily phosphohydrolase
MVRLLILACGFGLWLAAAEPFSFVVFGDNQCAINSATSGVPQRQALPLVVRDLKPTFILHTGDIMDHGWEPTAYARFREYYRPMLAVAPFFPTLGNHDAARKGWEHYKVFLKEQLLTVNPQVAPDFARECRVFLDDDPTVYPSKPGDPTGTTNRKDIPSGFTKKTYYAFRYRNLYVVSLEQGTRWWTNTPRPWLERHLKQASEDKTVEHIVVIMHHPVYSTTMRETPPNPEKPGSGECTGPVREYYEPLFRKYGVQLVFSGHAHLYDRFVVPNGKSETHYIVTGGGGGPLNGGGRQKDVPGVAFSKARVCDYHVVRVEVDGPQLAVSCILIQGNAQAPSSKVFEQFKIPSSEP